MRPMIKYIKDNLNDKNLIGVEIGVYKGGNSRNILDNLNIELLYSIDPYIAWKGDHFHNQGDYNLWYKVARNKLRKYNNSILIRDYSKNAIEQIPDNLDFIYIDGDHTYKGIKNDVELYYGKVKSGGIIGGHDFMFHKENKEINRYPGVSKYVQEFVKKYNLKLFTGINYDEINKRKEHISDWWVIK